jgi:Leucine-rich repeat (LRR) protein
MKNWLLFFILIKASSVIAQQSVPVFNNRTDSIEYANLQVAIQDTFKRERTAESAQELDSLFKLQFALREKIIGYKTIYTPDKTFTSYEDLFSGKVNPVTVTKLSLSGGYTKIPKNIISCTNLEELELVNTNVKKLPKSLARLPKVKSIYVYNNETKRPLKLGKNDVTKELLLRGMEADALPKSYKKFSSLEELDLSRNIGLTSFPDVYQNKKLKKLNLLENNLTLTDLKPIPHTSLIELNLQKNKIQKIPDAIGDFTALKKLSLNYNEITEVNENIGALTELEEMSFYHNKLKSIPSGIYDLLSLKTIDLYYNEIERVDPEISRLKNLEILYLSNNQLVSIPDDISELTNLRELYLSNNRLFMLPASLGALKKLTILRVNDNKLSDFPDFIFDLPVIENIDISANNISVIPSKVTELPKLSLFVLVDNPVNKDEVNISKIIEDLTAKGTIVHQNSVPIKISNTP